MKISSFSFQNLKGRPNEDYYLISKQYLIFAVADGVSRFTPKGKKYPKISGARLAAEEFCKTATTYLEKNYKKADLKILKRTFNVANRAIFNLNKKYGINKKLDYFSSCGAIAFIKKDFLYYGYLGDCGIRIYNQNDFLKLLSINNVPALEEWRDSQKFKSENEKEVFWRKILRNKPRAPYLTYGVFTGKPEVRYYYHIGKVGLRKRDLIFLHFDGFCILLRNQNLENHLEPLKGINF